MFAVINQMSRLVAWSDGLQTDQIETGPRVMRLRWGNRSRIALDALEAAVKASNSRTVRE